MWCGEERYKLRLFVWLKKNFYEDYNNFILWLIAFYAFGCMIYFSLNFEPNIWFLVAFSILLILLVILFRNNFKFFATSFLLFALSLGMLLSCYRTIVVSAPKLDITLNNVWLKGKIEYIYPLEIGKRIILRNAHIYSKELSLTRNLSKLQVTIKTKGDDFQIGDYVRLFASVQPVSSSLFPGKYDFGRHAYFNGVGATGYAMSRVKVIKKASSLSVLDKLERLRWKIFTCLYDAKNKNTSVAIAIMIGEQKSIDKKILEDMRKAGLTHILSVSGMHLSMLSIICFFLIRYSLSNFVFFAQKYNIKKIAAWASLLVTFVYLLISGIQIAALRSFIMVAFVIIAVILDRTEDAKRSVCFAALLILIFMPESIFHPSFQMSFSAVLALVSSYEFYIKYAKFERSVGLLSKIKIYFLGVAFSSLIAGSATAMFVIYHFGNYSNYSVIANLLAGPLVSFIIMPAVVLTFFLLPFGLHKIGLFFLNFGIDIMLKIAKYISEISSSFIIFPTINTSVIIIFVVGLLWLCLWQARWRFLGAVPMIAALVLLFNADFPSIVIDAKYKAVLIRQQHNLMQVGGKKRISRWHKEQWVNIANKEHIDRLIDVDKNYVIDDYLGYKLDLTFGFDNKSNALLSNLQITKSSQIVIINNDDLEKNGSYFIYLKPNKLQYEHAINNSINRPWS